MSDSKFIPFWDEHNFFYRLYQDGNNFCIKKDDEIILEKAVQGADGRYYQPKTYRFGDKFIRNDFGGHLFKDGASMGSHFNAGKIINGSFRGNGHHFFYGG